MVFVSELDEALEIADRIVVLHEHALVGDHANHNIDLPLVLSQYSGKANGPAQAQPNGQVNGG